MSRDAAGRSGYTIMCDYPLQPRLARGRTLALRALARGAVGCLVEPEAARVREERGRVRVWEHDCVLCVV